MNKKTEKYIYNKYAKDNGYEEAPPTIDEFLENDYYVGEITDNGKAIYPYWKNFLRDIYKTPFFEFDDNLKLNILGGSTGSGKCAAFRQVLEFELSEEDIKKYGLSEYLI